MDIIIVRFLLYEKECEYRVYQELGELIQKKKKKVVKLFATRYLRSFLSLKEMHLSGVNFIKYIENK